MGAAVDLDADFAFKDAELPAPSLDFASEIAGAPVGNCDSQLEKGQIDGSGYDSKSDGSDGHDESELEPATSYRTVTPSEFAFQDVGDPSFRRPPSPTFYTKLSSSDRGDGGRRSIARVSNGGSHVKDDRVGRISVSDFAFEN